MTRYYPLYVRRSDGKLETVHGKKKEKNEPTPEQLNDTPDSNGVSDYYRPIAEDEPKHLDWRRKLGGMLMRELAGPGSEHQHKACMLAALPENYRLFEHIKSRAHDGDPQSRKASKNHAGGGHDRQDAYLYGHPMGRKKRFRSPADFFPHLLWLATDKDGDANNCSCKVCCPEEVQDEKPAIKKEAPGQPAAQPGNPGIGRDPYVAIQRPPSSQSSTPKTQPAVLNRPSSAGAQPQPTPAPVQQAPPVQQVPAPRTTTPQNAPQTQPQPAPSAIPRLALPDHQLDSQYHSLLFRPGEVVWMSRGEAWGLGVLIRRYLTKAANNQVERHYIVQPLSHPHDFQTPVHLNAENLLRPWLAWSAPPLTFAHLQNRRDLTYENVDWQAAVSGQYGHGNPEVDASILAAKAVDNTYTPFKLISSRPGPGTEERRWAGVFLGAEKIWVGEPIRIQMDVPNMSLPIMVVIDIVERVQQGRSSITIYGDLYGFIGNLPLNQPVPPMDHLPPRMIMDLRFRNQVSSKTNRKGAWKLLRSMHQVPIEQVKGRWYESSVLLPIILGDKDFDNTIRSGNLQDASHWINARNDSNEANAIGVRQSQRKDAFGRSVPAAVQISDSLDPPSPEELQTIVAPAQAQQATDPALMVDAAGFGGMGAVSDVVGDFMNLDGDFIAGAGAGAAQGNPQGGPGGSNWSM
ncbi:Cryptic loci regulator 2 [Lasiodiplodia hormozganensis]|uniref:Cryptic loci regulator 2 n=1 Tax=Lasiodiplodia hormozganensis TaxID=869390 RepID=A0AA40CIU0_9PEZI|nr:Cryptic loci regulator 2 [Lasiodiplodia hormozganensis]